MDISYLKADTMTSLPIPLAQVYYRSKKCSFLIFFFSVYRSEKGKLVLMSVGQYLFSVLSIQALAYCGHGNPLDLLPCLIRFMMSMSSLFLSPDSSLVPGPL